MSRRAVVAALALAVLPAGPASAHTALSGSAPADGATTAGTEQVRLSFDGEVLERLSAVAVVGPDGRDAARGRPTLDGDDVVQPLGAPLAAGRWAVSYRVVSADGHPLTGRLSFTVTGTAPAAAAAPPPSAVPAGSAASAPSAVPAGSATSAPSAVPAGSAAPAPDGGSTSPVLVGALLGGGLVAGALALLSRRRRGARG